MGQDTPISELCLHVDLNSTAVKFLLSGIKFGICVYLKKKKKNYGDDVTHKIIIYTVFQLV